MWHFFKWLFEVKKKDFRCVNIENLMWLNVEKDSLKNNYNKNYTSQLFLLLLFSESVWFYLFRLIYGPNIPNVYLWMFHALNIGNYLVNMAKKHLVTRCVLHELVFTSAEPSGGEIL